MGEQSANLTALMETLLSKFDKEKILADKRAEAQTTFNAQVSLELKSLAKQIGLTQVEVDDVRKVASPSASSTPSTGSQVDEPATTPLRSAPTREAPVQPPPHDLRAPPPPSALPILQVLTGPV